jgi:hypothetical protein
MRAYQASMAAFVLLLVLATAFTGKAAPIGIHAECEDTVDNDLDGGIDSNDANCIEYPFADGNGESHTPQVDRFTAPEGYVSTIFDWWYSQVLNGGFTGDPCNLAAPSWYAAGNDGSGEQYDEFALNNCI